MAIIKADAYGHGAVPLAKALEENCGKILAENKKDIEKYYKYINIIFVIVLLLKLNINNKKVGILLMASSRKQCKVSGNLLFLNCRLLITWAPQRMCLYSIVIRSDKPIPGII